MISRTSNFRQPGVSSGDSLHRLVEGTLSVPRLMLTYPWMLKFLRQELSISRGIAHAYQDYITSISSEDMAISLRLASLLVYICQHLHPMVVIDLGSGFSSYALLVAAKALPNTIVHSVDADPKWLEATGCFCRSIRFQIIAFVLLRTFCRRASKRAI